MRRRLFNILSALSLALCVATVVLWVAGVSHTTVIFSGGAGFSGTLRWGIGMDFVVELGDRGGVSLGWSSNDVFEGIHVPYVMLAVCTTVLPVLWSWSCRAKHRAKPGLCVRCGYDLRASKERCPECGTPIPAGTSPVGADRPVSRPS